MQKQKIKLITLTMIILAAAFSRIIPHMPNFSPMDAITLFAAAHFTRKWQVFLIPFAALWLSSLFINNVIYSDVNSKFIWFYPGFHWQYAGYALIALMGLAIFRRSVTPGKIALGGIGSGLIFFLVSNLSVWVKEGFYEHTFAGLVACYTAGLPFYSGTFFGDVFYTTLLFGGYAALTYQFPVFQSRAYQQ